MGGPTSTFACPPPPPPPPSRRSNQLFSTPLGAARGWACWRTCGLLVGGMLAEEEADDGLTGGVLFEGRPGFAPGHSSPLKDGVCEDAISCIAWLACCCATAAAAALPNSELKNALEYADAPGGKTAGPDGGPPVEFPAMPKPAKGNIIPLPLGGTLPRPKGKAGPAGGIGCELRLGLIFCSWVTRNCCASCW